MSFLDKVTKAVGDVVDKGKREVDEFVRIQKINGQIGEIEKKITEFRKQIDQTKVEIAEKAVGMVRAGTLTSPDLQAMVDQITGVEQQIAASRRPLSRRRRRSRRSRPRTKPTTQRRLSPQHRPQRPPLQPSSARSAAPRPEPAPFCSQCGTKIA